MKISAAVNVLTIKYSNGLWSNIRLYDPEYLPEHSNDQSPLQKFVHRLNLYDVCLRYGVCNIFHSI